MTIQVSKQYVDGDMIQITLEDSAQRVSSFVSSEHLFYAKAEQLKRLYFNKEEDFNFL